MYFKKGGFPEIYCLVKQGLNFTVQQFSLAKHNRLERGLDRHLNYDKHNASL